MKRVIAITGGHGVLGRAVLEAALAAGLAVAVIDHAEGHPVPAGVLEVGGVDLTDPAQALESLPSGDFQLSFATGDHLSQFVPPRRGRLPRLRVHHHIDQAAAQRLA